MVELKNGNGYYYVTINGVMYESFDRCTDASNMARELNSLSTEQRMHLLHMRQMERGEL